MGTSFGTKALTAIIAGLFCMSLLISPVVASNQLPEAAPQMPLVQAGSNSGASPAAAGSIMFIENKGQYDGAARFQVRGASETIWLAENTLWINVLEKPATPETGAVSPLEQSAPDSSQPGQASAGKAVKGVVLKLSYPGSNPHPVLEPFNRLQTHVSYLIGRDATQWHTDVPVWGGVRYKNLYPKIDLEVTSLNGQIIQRLVPHAGANMKVVKMQVDGGKLSKTYKPQTTSGFNTQSMQMDTAVGTYNLPQLQVSTNSSASRGISPSSDGLAAIGDAIPLSGSADLLFGTFIGGYNYDDGGEIATDPNGAVYVTGTTYSSDFVPTPGGFDTTLENRDEFVVKFNPSGSTIYATLLGGAGYDSNPHIAVDSGGNAYITGMTSSMDFPYSPSAFDSSTGGDNNVFVAKLNATGTALTYATRLGKATPTGITVNTNREVFVTGFVQVYNSTNYPDDSIPATVNSYNTVINGYADAFVAQLNSTGSALLYSTYLGGLDMDYGLAIAVDGSGAFYVTGNTSSEDFPTTANTLDAVYAGGTCSPLYYNNFYFYYYSSTCSDSFVTKFVPGGANLAYSTYLGGSNNDLSTAIAIGPDGSAYLTGLTASTDFPFTNGAYDSTYNSSVDAFVAKINPGGNSLTYSTYLGGPMWDGGSDIAIDAGGSAYITGYAAFGFPTTPDGYNTSFSGCSNNSTFCDAFVSRLSADGSTLGYSSFLGGSTMDQGNGIALGSGGAIYVAGITDSSDWTMPNGTLHGNQDVFLVKLLPGSVASTATPTSLVSNTPVPPTNTPTLTSTSSPATNTYTPAPGGSNSFTSVSAGYYHTCAVNSIGGAQCWGFGSYGQLGNGSTLPRSTPVDVSGLGSGVTAVSSGNSHTCALTSGGAVKCWGYNYYGQLGNGTFSNSNLPVPVNGLTSGVVAVSSGKYHTCALLSGGGIKCWGGNSSGELGNGSTADSNIPVDVSGLTSGVTAISAGDAHTCAITTTGAAKCWGINTFGQLGNASNTNSSIPVSVSGLTSGVSSISAGGGQTCSLSSSGLFKCWGYNLDGELGIGTFTASTIPVGVDTLASGNAITAGAKHTCAIVAGGSAACWGYNYYGQLGIGTTTDSTLPKSVFYLTNGVSRISAGGLHTCALVSGILKCWGSNAYGQLGDGSTTNRTAPVNVITSVLITYTPTNTATPTNTVTPTRTNTPLISPTFTATPTKTNTPTLTSTRVPSNTPTRTSTSSPTPTFTSSPTATFTPTPSRQVILSLFPANQTVNANQLFSVFVNVQAKTQPVDGVSAYLNFDPTYLQVVSITPGTSLPLPIQNTYNNSTGQIDYMAGILAPTHPTGTFKLLTVNFRSVKPVVSTSLQFNLSEPRKTNATNIGETYLNSAVDATISINNQYSLSGKIALQGRPTPPIQNFSVPLSVGFTLQGDSLPTYTRTTQSDSGGYFSINDIPNGIYDITVKHSHTLQVKQYAIDLSNYVSPLDFQTLPEGDANNDNVVNLVDFSILSSTYGKCLGTAGFDARADFNEDSCIGILDFSLLQRNIGVAGQSNFQLGSGEISTAGITQLAIEPAISNVTVGKDFNITVKVNAGTQRVDGAQVALRFDPKLIQVKQISAGSALTQPLENTYNNSAGTIDYSAGEFSNYPSGTFDLLTITFHAIRPGTTSTLAFRHSQPHDSNVTFGGASIFGSGINGKLVIDPLKAQYSPNAGNDGWVLESGEKTEVGGSFNSNLGTLRLGDDAARKQYRSLLWFNTAALPDNAVITNITLKIKKQGIVGTANPFRTFQGLMIDFNKGSFNQDALEKTDFQAVANASFGPFNTIPLSNIYSIGLGKAAAFINKTGPTQLRLAFKLDDNGNSIADFISFYSANDPTALNRPQLVIEYYLPGN